MADIEPRRGGWFGVSGKDIVTLLTLGALSALGQAPWSLWWVSLVAFGAVFWRFGTARDARQAALMGWLVGTGYFALALFWIVEPFLVDLMRHGWMAPFALVFLSGGLGLLWAVAFGLSAHWPRGVARSVALVVFLTIMEMLRAVLFTGFPWALIGYIWSDHALLQLAAFVGPHGLTGLTLMLAAVIGDTVRARKPLPVIIMAALFVAATGTIHRNLDADPPRLTDKTVRLVQPSAEQHLKWRAENIPVYFERQLGFTSAPTDTPLDLIVWPETAVAYRIETSPAVVDLIADAANGVPVVFGLNSVVDEQYRNTMAMIGEDGTLTERYYKHHLVPFGEYIPFGDLLGQVGIRGLAARDGAGFGAGPGPQVMEIAGLGTVLPLICYELIFPRHFRAVPRTDMILQITNDAWFGNISGPYQHLAQAQIRAVEQGLPVLRAANTGISAVIDGRGRIVAQTKLNEPTYLDAAIPAALSATIYSSYGDWPMRSVVFVLLSVLIAVRRRVSIDG